jgi:hypothetical protein
VIDSYDGDEELQPLVASVDVAKIPSVSETFFVPAIPSVKEAFVLPVIPSVSEEFFIPGIPSVEAVDVAGFYYPDTIPRRTLSKTRQWKEFNDEFEKKFKERFKDFYEKNQKDLDKMMKEIQKSFESSRLDQQEWELARQSEDLAYLEAEMMRRNLETVEGPVYELAPTAEGLRAQEAALADIAEMNKLQQLELEGMSEDMERWAAEKQVQMAYLERDMKELEAEMKVFEKTLREQLRKDGYISTKEEIKDFKWDENGDFSVNGKKIKEADIKKYQDLHKKYFKRRPVYTHPE